MTTEGGRKRKYGKEQTVDSVHVPSLLALIDIYAIDLAIDTRHWHSFPHNGTVPAAKSPGYAICLTF